MNWRKIAVEIVLPVVAGAAAATLAIMWIENNSESVAQGLGEWIGGIHREIRENLPDTTPEGWKPRFPGDVPPPATASGAGRWTSIAVDGLSRKT